MEPITMALAGGSLLSGLFGGSAKVDDKWMRDLMAEYGATADKWFDPNNQFYTQSTQRQKQNLMDMYLAGNREKRKQLASQGINSQYMNSMMQKDAMSKSAEGANNFALDIYNRGLGVGQQFAQMASGMAGNLANTRMSNQQSVNSKNNQFMGMGLGLLGNYLGGAGGTIPKNNYNPFQDMNSSAGYLQYIPTPGGF